MPAFDLLPFSQWASPWTAAHATHSSEEEEDSMTSSASSHSSHSSSSLGEPHTSPRAMPPTVSFPDPTPSILGTSEESSGDELGAMPVVHAMSDRLHRGFRRAVTRKGSVMMDKEDMRKAELEELGALICRRDLLDAEIEDRRMRLGFRPQTIFGDTLGQDSTVENSDGARMVQRKLTAGTVVTGSAGAYNAGKSFRQQIKQRLLEERLRRNCVVGAKILLFLIWTVFGTRLAFLLAKVCVCDFDLSSPWIQMDPLEVVKLIMWITIFLLLLSVLWWCHHPAFYGLTVTLTSSFIAAHGFEILTPDCADFRYVTSSCNETDWEQDHPHGRKDCNAMGGAYVEMLAVWVLLSTFYIPDSRYMHLNWVGIWAVFLATVIVWVQSDEGVTEKGKFDVYLTTFFMCSVNFIAMMRKWNMEEREVSSLVLELKQTDLSRHMFHLLEYMVPAFVITPMLQVPGGIVAKKIDCATVLFVIIDDFDTISHKMAPQKLLDFLNLHFLQFDKICERHGVTKIETVREEYVCAVGVSPEDIQEYETVGHSGPLGRLVRVAVDMLSSSVGGELMHSEAGPLLKCGMHTGSVLAGVVGHKLPRFRLFGDTMNTAARMMQRGVAGEVQTGELTKSLFPDWVNTVCRGEIEMKGKGMVRAYLVDRTSGPLARSLKSGSSSEEDRIRLRRHTYGHPSEDHRPRTELRSRSATFSAVLKTQIRLAGHRSMGSDPKTQQDDLQRFQAMLEEMRRLEHVHRHHSGRACHSEELYGAYQAFKCLPQAWAAGPGGSSSSGRATLPLSTSAASSAAAAAAGSGAGGSGTQGLRHIHHQASTIGSIRAATSSSLEEEETWKNEFEEWFVLECFGRGFQRRLRRIMAGIVTLTLAESSFALIGFMGTTTAAFSKNSDDFRQTTIGMMWEYLVLRVLALLIVVVWYFVQAFRPHWILRDAHRARRSHQLLSFSIAMVGSLLYLASWSLPPDAYMYSPTLNRSGKLPVPAYTPVSFIRLQSSIVFIITVYSNPMFFSQAVCVFFLSFVLAFYASMVSGDVGFASQNNNTSVKLDSTRTNDPSSLKFIFVIAVWIHAYGVRVQQKKEQYQFRAQQDLEFSQSRMSAILNTLMPPLVVEELRRNPPSAALPCHRYHRATIVQADLVGFTALCSGLQPYQVLMLVSDIFGMFDRLTDLHDVYKIETVGDAYIAGQAETPLTRRNSPLRVGQLGLDMVRGVHNWALGHEEVVDCRVGIHTGECVGGIVGANMQRYHLFGAMMAQVELLESTAPSGEVQTSTSYVEALEAELEDRRVRGCDDDIRFEPRHLQVLSTSKGETHHIREVGGPTFLLRGDDSMC